MVAYGFLDLSVDTISSSMKQEAGLFYFFIPQASEIFLHGYGLHLKISSVLSDVHCSLCVELISP